MSILSKRSSSILAPLSRSNDEIPSAMAPTGATFALPARTKSGFLGRLFGASGDNRLMQEFDEKKLESTVKEALGIELNRIALVAGYQRLVDHLYIGERTGELAPKVADHFASIQSAIKNTINERLTDDAKTIHSQRKALDTSLARDEIGVRTHARQMALLEQVEDTMIENLHGLLTRLTENAAKDLLRTLSLLDTSSRRS